MGGVTGLLMSLVFLGLSERGTLFALVWGLACIANQVVCCWAAERIWPVPPPSGPPLPVCPVCGGSYADASVWTVVTSIKENELNVLQCGTRCCTGVMMVIARNKVALTTTTLIARGK